MLRVRRGDPDAFAELVGRYWSRVFGRFYNQFGDRQEAEDLTQDVFLRVHRHSKRYRPTAKFSTWLFHISQNVSRNALRSRRRHPHERLVTQGGEDNTCAFLPGHTSDSPSLRLERAELVRAVRVAVAGLRGRQRLALELHQFHDRTYAEVAAEMDMSPKAAKSLLYRARHQLRISLTALME